MSSLKVRTISSIVLLIISVTAIILGQWAYTFYIALVVFLAAYEYTRIFKTRGYTLSSWLVWAIITLWFIDAFPNVSISLLAPGLGVLSICTVLWTLWRRQTQPNVTSLAEEWALTLAGGIYFGMGGAYLVRLRAFPDGLWWVLTAFPVLWVGESAAYLIGSRWGRHKMAPKISPGKSWEGYVAEVVCGTLASTALGALWPAVCETQLTVNGYYGLLLGIVLSTITPAGDFFISLLKREVGVKDSGSLIPGHGGMLDRIDSLLWAGFLAWGMITLIVGL